MLENFSTYHHSVDLFIHTNKSLNTQLLIPYSNGKYEIIVHQLQSNLNPYYLTWLCRPLLKSQSDSYDVFMYHENDILIPQTAFDYWVQNKDVCIQNGYNLGFIRIDTKDNIEYSSDIRYYDRITKTVKIENKDYIFNDVNPYCAFWIYDQSQFQKWSQHHYFNIESIKGYGVPESSGIGVNGLKTEWYKGTVIPMNGSGLPDECKIYHMTSNFAKDPNSIFGKIPFHEIIQLQ